LNFFFSRSQCSPHQIIRSTLATLAGNESFVFILPKLSWTTARVRRNLEFMKPDRRLLGNDRLQTLLSIVG